MKRIACFLMVLVMVLSLFPVHAHAQETEPVVMETTITETQPTEETTPEPTAPVETVPETAETVPTEEIETVEETQTAPVLYASDNDPRNDTKSGATQIILDYGGETVYGALGKQSGSSDQVDYYYFTLSSQAEVTITCTAPVAISLTVESSSGQECGGDWGTDITVAETLSSGTYYIKLLYVGESHPHYTLKAKTDSNGSGGGSGGTSCDHYYYNGWVVDKEPTCTQWGSRYRVCWHCNEKDTEPLAPLGHELGSWTVTKEPTCTQEGQEATECTRCKETLTQSIEQAPHLLKTDKVLDKAPSREAEGEYSGFCTTCNSEQSVTIPKLEATARSFVIDDGVVKIGNGAFSGGKYPYGLDVSIPASVTHIGSDAFNGCTSMRIFITSLESWCNITFEDPEAQPSATLFINGELLRDCMIPEGVTSIRDYAFRNIYLESVSIPASVTSIGKEAFYRRGHLENVTLLEGLTTIGERAFYGCDRLTSINLPSTVTSIGKEAFENCSALAIDLTIPAGASVGEEAFYRSGLTSVTILEGANIGTQAFSYCDSLKRVTLSDGITGELWAFTGCNKIAEVSVPSLEAWFDYSSMDITCAKLYINGELLTECVIPENITYIPMYAFSGLQDLKSVTIPDHVTSIGMYAFSRSAIESVTIPGSVETIYHNAFANCNNLTKVLFSEGLKTIWDNAFYRCNNLNSITIPASVTQIGKDAFQKSCYGRNTTLYFIGDAPKALEGEPFYVDDYKKICYPSGNSTWTSEKIAELFPGDRRWIEWVACEHSFEGIGCTSGGTCKCGAQLGPQHSFTDYIPNNDATCTQNGTKTAKCDYCEKKHTVTDPNTVKGHTEVTLEAKIPTCTEPGLTEGKKCSVCQEIVKKQQEIPALGHTEVIDNAVTASCTTTGLTEGTHCDVCGEILIEQKEVPMTEHQYENGTCTVCGEADPSVPTEAAITRIAGDGRCQTAMEAAEELKKIQGVEKFRTILVADGNNYPDALSGSYLAAVTNAPILLVQANQKKVTQTVKEYILSNLTADATVYILGGTNSIPTDFETSIRTAGYTVKRLAGNDRYLTSLMIIQEGDALLAQQCKAPADSLLVCAGGGYADSLSASATGRPVLLVNGGKTSLTTSQKTYLDSIGKRNIFIIGGPNSVSNAIATQLNAYDTDGATKRIAGDGREETSAKVAQEFFPEASFAVLANAGNYPDGLSGGPVAYAKQAPLLLIRAKHESYAKDYVGDRIKNGCILGGPNSVSDNSAKAIFGESSIIK